MGNTHSIGFFIDNYISHVPSTIFISYYNGVIMSTMASQITSELIAYTTVCPGTDQRKHQSSMSLAFVPGIHQWPVNSPPHTGPVTRKSFHLWCHHEYYLEMTDYLLIFNVDHGQTGVTHYNDVIMGTIASQITSLMIAYSIIYSDADQSKHQSSTSLAFVRGIHRGPMISPHKWPVTQKMFPFDDIILHWHNRFQIHNIPLLISKLWRHSSSQEIWFIQTHDDVKRKHFLHYWPLWGEFSDHR